MIIFGLAVYCRLLKLFGTLTLQIASGGFWSFIVKPLLDEIYVEHYFIRKENKDPDNQDGMWVSTW